MTFGKDKETKSTDSGQAVMSEREERQWERLYLWYREFHARFAPYFIRAEARQRSGRYVHALLKPVEIKNGWHLAKAMGEWTPDGAQRLW